jgi:2-polyprenyl-3-methyl-5-hydroxy-6-metoxy-1,4-benzoquinol methylase
LEDKTQNTIAAYNKNYQRFAEKFMDYAPYVKQVEKFSGYLKDGFRLLDIGCGPGNVAKQLCAAKRLDITGIDLSEKMLELARQQVPQGRFYLQDSRKAVFPASSFDAIILSFSIVHLETEAAKLLLLRAAEWLKPGGYLYVSFMEGKQAGFETTSFSQEALYFNYFQEAAIRRLLTETQVVCIHSEKQDYPEPDGSVTTDVFLFGHKIGHYLY